MHQKDEKIHKSSLLHSEFGVELKGLADTTQLGELLAGFMSNTYFIRNTCGEYVIHIEGTGEADTLMELAGAHETDPPTWLTSANAYANANAEPLTQDNKHTTHTATTHAALAMLPAPAVLLLQGDLGAGKTTLARAFTCALPGGRESEVNSPSFTLCNEYPTMPPVLHFDLYRLEAWQEDENILDALDEAANGEVLLLIEWPENLKKEFLPENFMRCRLTGSENNRTAFIECAGKTALAGVCHLQAECKRLNLQLVR